MIITVREEEKPKIGLTRQTFLACRSECCLWILRLGLQLAF